MNQWPIKVKTVLFLEEDRENITLDQAMVFLDTTSKAQATKNIGKLSSSKLKMFVFQRTQ